MCLHLQLIRKQRIPGNFRKFSIGRTYYLRDGYDCMKFIRGSLNRKGSYCCWIVNSSAVFHIVVCRCACNVCACQIVCKSVNWLRSGKEGSWVRAHKLVILACPFLSKQSEKWMTAEKVRPSWWKNSCQNENHIELVVVQVQEKNRTASRMSGGVEQALDQAPVVVLPHALRQILAVGKLHRPQGTKHWLADWPPFQNIPFLHVFWNSSVCTGFLPSFLR